MTLEEQFQNVEKVLATFPIEARENYYENKKTLQIKKVSNLEVLGNYDIPLNQINLKNPEVLEHELFHSASINRKIFKTPINDQFRFCGGITYIRNRGFVLGTLDIMGTGLNEGLVQSLAERAKMKVRGVRFETYIANLLTSIYGDDLYYYLLTNNPMGFYDACSSNIDNVRKDLDWYYYYKTVYNERKELNIDLKNDFMFHYAKGEIVDHMELSIKNIITEYHMCSNKMITEKELKQKIKMLFDDDEFWDTLPFKDRVEQKIMPIIDEKLGDQKRKLK